MYSSWSNRDPSDYEYQPNSPSSSESSLDEDEANRRITPHWPSYRNIVELRGFQLETVRDVKQFYTDYMQSPATAANVNPTYLRICKEAKDEDSLCHDEGLRDNLFRGFRICDGKRVMVKAVHACSHEYKIIHLLSTPPLCDDPMNHTIPVLDFIEADDGIALIVMEEWSPQLITDMPCCLSSFLSAIRQCIEHTVFMHKHCIAHLDISLRNMLTDYHGHYAYIDFELSRRYTGMFNPSIRYHRGTEVPPECERGELANPYKVDVWALGVLILRACKLTGYYVPELMQVTKPMLHEIPHRRPSIHDVLHAFDFMVSTISDSRLRSTCPTSHSWKSS